MRRGGSGALYMSEADGAGAADAGKAGRQILQADGVAGGSAEVAAEQPPAASGTPKPTTPTPPPSVPGAPVKGAQAPRFDGLHTVAGGSSGSQAD